MKMHRLYADKNGESHFQDVEIEYAETTRAGRLSKRMPATGIRGSGGIVSGTNDTTMPGTCKEWASVMAPRASSPDPTISDSWAPQRSGR